jgi:aspyridone synthetase trans-acting enoyl reductase
MHHLNMLSTTTSQKALKVVGPGHVELTDGIPIPQPQADEVLVRVVYVALNPVDAKSADLSPAPGATMGCDFSGDIVTVGSAVKKALSVGDRVCGAAFGNNPDEPHNGAFAEYVVHPGDLVLKIPPNMSYQAAATLGIGLATVGLGLYQTMKLPLPSSSSAGPQFVLIHGGGTATGTLAIQMARM